MSDARKVPSVPVADAPGFEWRNRKTGRVPYWVAPKKAVAAGFTPRTVKLTLDANAAEIARTCRGLQAEALEFVALGDSDRSPARFDGSVQSLLRLYQTDPLSKFRSVKWNTRKTYTVNLAILEREVGERQLHSLSARDFQRWYEEFRKPASEDGPQRISRAHYLMTLLRMVIKFGVALEIEQCMRLRSVLSAMEFENARPRKAILTAAMVSAFCSEAHRTGRPSLALATVLQFECALRQKDVIGEWVQVEGEDKKHGAGGKRWTNGLRWGEHISSDLILRKATSKSRGNSETEVDLKLCPMVMAELQYIAPERRIGPVIVSETMRRPYMQDAFCWNWRDIARRAGIPDNVWNMDARAGAISEGAEAGATIGHLQSFATHKSDRITNRYIRGNSGKNADVARLRIAHRIKKGEEAS
jgi:hypothetical protein